MEDFSVSVQLTESCTNMQYVKIVKAMHGSPLDCCSMKR